MKVLRVNNLSKGFTKTDKTYIKAIENITFSLNEGEILAIVGESGSGKSTLAKTIMRIYKADSGEIIYNNKKIYKEIQMIFQNAYDSLNPRKSILESLKEPFKIQKIKNDKNQELKIIEEVLRNVNLNNSVLYKKPNELSGGERQRVALGRALLMEPRIIIADEAISSLDICMQEELLQLVDKFRKQNNISWILISHDLDMIRKVSDRVIVMKSGTIVELGYTKEIFDNPKSEYTKKLINSMLKI